MTYLELSKHIYEYFKERETLQSIEDLHCLIFNLLVRIREEEKAKCFEKEEESK